ncbi:MAG: response regulator transcription factor [Aestuariivirgaceae bacterium]|nr:response regulator transcription factor [Aestuariivirgaceae bacterium]
MTGHKIIIADDHPLFRDALKQALEGAGLKLEIDEAGALDKVITALEAGDGHDLILLDLKMPGVQGFSGLVYLRAQYPAIPVVVVSGNEDTDVMRRAVALGASGFIPKSSTVQTMRDAVAAVLDGAVWMPPGVSAGGAGDAEGDKLALRLATLTPQQVRVLMMLREGLLNKQIAYNLSVSEATVKAHVSAILQKLNVESRTQAVIAASRIDGDAVQSVN